MPYASADGVRIYYEVHGSGPALVLLHGGGANHACWYQQIAHWRDRFTVVTLDFPGYGLSDSEGEMFDALEFAPAIGAVLDDADIERAILVAQTMGTVPGLAFAAAHPQRVVAAVLAHGTGGISDEEVDSVARADRKAADEQFTIAQKMWSEDFGEPDQVKILLYRQLGTFNAAGHDRILHAESGEVTLEQVRAAIAAGVDLTYVQGTADKVVTSRTYERLKEVLPDANFEVAQGASHLSYWDTPDVFNEAVDRVLERVAQAV